MSMDPVERGRELVEKNLKADQRTGERKSAVSTSQLRKVLSAANILQNNLYKDTNESDQLSPEFASQVKYLKARLAYQIGRARENRNTQDSIPVLDALMKEVDAVGNDRKKFDDFGRLIESVVAYHKYYGGKE